MPHYFSIVLTGFLLTTILSAQTAKITGNDIEKLMKASGIEGQIQEIPGVAIRLMKQILLEIGSDSLDSEELAHWTDSTRLLAAKVVTKYMADAEVGKAIAWYESALGQRVVERQVLNYDSTAMPKLDDQKKAAIETLLKTMQMREFNNVFALEIGGLVGRAMTWMPMKQKGLTDEQIVQMYESPEFQEAVRNNAKSDFDITTYYFIYGPFSEHEMEDIISFYKSPPGQNFRKAIMEVVITTTRKMTPFMQRVFEKNNDRILEYIQETGG